jgi:hypothetical protein
MTASELRIGNYINRTSKAFKDKPLGVTQVDLDTFYWIVECIDDFDNYEPIPLTEEWLVRMGFEIKENYYWINNKFFGGYAFDLVRNCLVKEYPCSANEFHTTDIEYVHQLQNLYFALTGQELIIKP